MSYHIVIPLHTKEGSKFAQTIVEDKKMLKDLGVTESFFVIEDQYEIECAPEVLTLLLLSIKGASVVSTTTDKTQQ